MKQSGKVRNSPQKCHSNLQNVLKLSARFHFFSPNLQNFVRWYIYISKVAEVKIHGCEILCWTYIQI